MPCRRPRTRCVSSSTPLRWPEYGSPAQPNQSPAACGGVYHTIQKHTNPAYRPAACVRGFLYPRRLHAVPGYAIIPLSTTISRQGEERYEKTKHSGPAGGADGAVSGRICGGCYVPAGDHQRTGRGRRQADPERMAVRYGPHVLLAVCLAGPKGAAELLFIKAGAVLPVPLPQRGGAAVLPHAGQLPVVHHCYDGRGGFPGQPRGGKAQPQQCPGSGSLWSGAGGGSYF